MSANGGYFPYSGVHISDTSAHSGSWVAVVALEDSVLALESETLKGTDGNNISSMKLGLGAQIRGVFSKITLASGSVVAYQSVEGW